MEDFYFELIDTIKLGIVVLGLVYYYHGRKETKPSPGIGNFLSYHFVGILLGMLGSPAIVALVERLVK